MESEEHNPEQLNKTDAGEEAPEACETQAAETGASAGEGGGGKALKADEALKSFEGRTVSAPKKSKYGWLSYVLLAVAVGLGLWAMFGIAKDMGEKQSFGAVIKGGDWRFALVLLAVILAILACDWMKYSVIMKTTTGKFNLKTSLKVQLLGKFYDNVTPFAVGGQPMQIYYLHKKGYTGGVSSAVVLTKYFIQMFCLCTVSLVLMACNVNVLGGMGDTAWRTVILVGAWIGIASNLFLPVMIILFVALPRFSHRLASFVVGIGHKLRIVKDKDKTVEKAFKTVDDFRASIKIMSRKPLNFIALILLCITEVLLRYALPFFIMKMFCAFGEGDGGFTTLISVMALNVYATQSVAIIPTPGNSGAIESTGTLAFSAFVKGSVLSWSVFVWRLSVYYIYVVIGIGLIVFEFIRKLVRRRLRRGR